MARPQAKARRVRTTISGRPTGTPRSSSHVCWPTCVESAQPPISSAFIYPWRKAGLKRAGLTASTWTCPKSGMIPTAFSAGKVALRLFLFGPQLLGLVLQNNAERSGHRSPEVSGRRGEIGVDGLGLQILKLQREHPILREGVGRILVGVLK